MNNANHCLHFCAIPKKEVSAYHSLEYCVSRLSSTYYNVNVSLSCCFTLLTMHVHNLSSSLLMYIFFLQNTPISLSVLYCLKQRYSLEFERFRSYLEAHELGSWRKLSLICMDNKCRDRFHFVDNSLSTWLFLWNIIHSFFYLNNKISC